MPSRSRTNGARRPYQKHGLYKARSAAGALMERAADETVADADLSPVELEAREWTRAVVKRVGRKRVTPVVGDRILLAGALRIVVFTTLETVRNLAVRGRLVDKKRARFRPLTREWPELAKRYLDLAAPLDLPAELEGNDLRRYIADPAKPWNKRGEAEGLSTPHGEPLKARRPTSQAPAPTRTDDHSAGSVNHHQDASPERPQGVAGPKEEGTPWSV